MAEQEPMMHVEIGMPLSVFEKFKAVQEEGQMTENEFFLDSLIKGVVINGLERQGLFVIAVDEERDTTEFLDTHQAAFEQAATPREAARSLEPKIRRFRPKGE